MTDSLGVEAFLHLSDPWNGLLVLLAGVAAGFINILAGGGSLIALPALIFLGLPDTTANGTVRIAILAQNITALSRYQKAEAIHWDIVRKWALPIILGATCGAWVGTQTTDANFRMILSAVMLGVGALLVLKPKGLFEAREDAGAIPPAVGALLMVGVGFYGGFIQAGVGYLLLGTLTLGLGLRLMTANVLKVAFVTLYTPIAIGLFALEGKIDWGAGAILAVGQSLGAWIGATAALKKGESIIRAVLFIAITLGAIKLLGGF
jgi:uncharacterized membrane protein YfcA